MQIYNQLWREAMAAFARGEPRLDPHLPAKTRDPRRGVSLAFRPPLSVQSRLQPLLDSLAAEFPGQYFYPPADLHVTVLTLISGSETWRREIGDVRVFRDILREVLGRHAPFAVAFRGVTAAPNAVMIQGFPQDDTLEQIRQDLRQTFRERGFADRLDRRYANQAAHVTAVRFCNPRADWPRLAAVLAAHRQTDFGQMQVTRLQLVFGDWYATAGRERLLEEFAL
jgi:2'-5' RNA ligase